MFQRRRWGMVLIPGADSGGLFSIASTPSVGSTQPAVQWVPVPLPHKQGVRTCIIFLRLKNVWSCISKPSYVPLACCLSTGPTFTYSAQVANCLMSINFPDFTFIRSMRLLTPNLASDLPPESVFKCTEAINKKKMNDGFHYPQLLCGKLISPHNEINGWRQSR